MICKLRKKSGEGEEWFLKRIRKLDYKILISGLLY
jgi:hypothetical protein